MLARCEKKLKARMIWVVRSRDSAFNIASRSRRAVSSSSRWKRMEVRRIRSTMSKTVSPSCSRTVSPRMRPSRRISSRSGRSFSGSSLGLLLRIIESEIWLQGTVTLYDPRYLFGKELHCFVRQNTARDRDRDEPGLRSDIGARHHDLIDLGGELL